MIEIRFLNANELQWAVNTANEVFEICVRGYVGTQEELTQYYNYVQAEYLWQEMSAGRLFLWGVFEDGQMCAVSAMQNTGHVTMLYVRPQFQNRRMGTQLLNGMIGYAASVLQANRITINVTPAAATPYFYRKGFIQLPKAWPNQPYVSVEYPLVQMTASAFRGYPSGVPGNGAQPGAQQEMPGNGAQSGMQPGMSGNGAQQEMPGYGAQPGAQREMPGNGTQMGVQPGMPGNGAQPGMSGGAQTEAQSGMSAYGTQGGMQPVPAAYRVTYPTRAVSPKVVLIITAVILLVSFGIGSGTTIRHMVKDGMYTQSDLYEELPEGFGNVEEL